MGHMKSITSALSRELEKKFRTCLQMRNKEQTANSLLFDSETGTLN